ncbi:MAG TPA: glutathione S-transferase family protein, partial [Burkholderiales bacterium]|nr:glutathione S-transferase family protein [Burkholderiales bacterium]
MTGYLDNGRWRTGWYDTQATRGEFRRPPTRFRNWISPDGATGFPAEPNRYHLYVSLACPWAHRCLIFRALKRLDPIIGVSIVDPVMGDEGWA